MQPLNEYVSPSLHCSALVLLVKLLMQDPFSGLESTLGAQGMTNEDFLGSAEQLVQRLNKEEEVIEMSNKISLGRHWLREGFNNPSHGNFPLGGHHGQDFPNS